MYVREIDFFCGTRKTGKPSEKLSHMSPGLGIEPGSHWWEAGVGGLHHLRSLEDLIMPTCLHGIKVKVKVLAMFILCDKTFFVHAICLGSFKLKHKFIKLIIYSVINCELTRDIKILLVTLFFFAFPEIGKRNSHYSASASFKLRKMQRSTNWSADYPIIQTSHVRGGEVFFRATPVLSSQWPKQ